MFLNVVEKEALNATLMENNLRESREPDWDIRDSIRAANGSIRSWILIHVMSENQLGSIANIPTYTSATVSLVPS